MRRFIITGTPGSGKTTIIRQLQLEGFSVAEEATDVIAGSPRELINPGPILHFNDLIAKLQRDRQIHAFPNQMTFSFTIAESYARRL